MLQNRKCLICIFLGHKLKILLSYLKSSNLSCSTGILKKLFEISTLEFVYLQNLMEKQKYLNLGAKITLFGFFGLEFEKRYCDIWNLHPWICLVAKFDAKLKILEFGTKNTWFGYCWARISKKCCHIWNQHTGIDLIAKFSEIMKMAKFGTKKSLFRYFWARIFKKLLSYLKSAPSNLLFCKISRKKQLLCLNMGDQKCLIWAFLG